MSITGLGSPVVPLENGSSATADGAVARVAAGRPRSAASGVRPSASPSATSSRTPASAAAARATPASSGAQTSTDAPASASWRASSRRVDVGRSAGRGAARGHRGERDARPLRAVGREDREHVARPEAARAQAGGDLPDPRGEERRR